MPASSQARTLQRSLTNSNQAIATTITFLGRIWLPVIIIAAGIGLRLLAATRGHNFDLESYIIVAEIVDRGGNVYAETIRYNYGPVWLHVVYLLDQLAAWVAADPGAHFRYLVAAFLSLIDLGIFAIFWRRMGRASAYLFLLNPIAILITGYHSQFDNMAIFLGMLAVLVYGDAWDQPVRGRKLLGLCLLGLSLMTKHLLFAFPFWLAVKQRGLSQKIIVMFVPLMLFALGFTFYWPDGRDGIMQNVFLYRSFDNQIFFRLFVPGIIRHITGGWTFWLLALALFAIMFRPRKALDSLLLYTAVVVATSPAIANQYLAIVIPFVAAYMNGFLLLYTLVGTWYLLVNQDGLNIAALQSLIDASREEYYALLIALLTSGFIWRIWQPQLVAVLKRAVRRISAEVRIQLGNADGQAQPHTPAPARRLAPWRMLNDHHGD